MSEDAESKTAMQIAASLTDDVYKDGVQSSIQTIGQALDGILKAISHYPRYWGMMSDISLEAKQKKFRDSLQAKLDAIPEKDRGLPSPNILGPTVQALEYAVLDEEISVMFASLLASASDKTKSAHPAFVEVIKNLSQSDAKFLNNIWRLPEFRSQGGSIENSQRFLAIRSHISLGNSYTGDYLRHIAIANGIHWIGRSMAGFSLKGERANSVSGWILSDAVFNLGIEESVDNLIRLGLLEYIQIKSSIDESHLEFYLDQLIKEANTVYGNTLRIDINKIKPDLINGEKVNFTSFGYKFASCCITEE